MTGRMDRQKKEIIEKGKNKEWEVKKNEKMKS